MFRALTDQSPTGCCVPLHSRTDFYREEFLKYQQCLERHRDCFPAQTIADVEAVLTRLISQLERLCLQKDVDQVVSGLLKQLDVVIRPVDWSGNQVFH